MNVGPHGLNRKDVQRRFDRAAARFSHGDFVHRHTAAGLLERMQPMRVEGKRVLDLGVATGGSTRMLARRFRHSTIIGLDLSAAMLARARRRRPWFCHSTVLRADACRLPLRDASMDVVFANMLLPWIEDLDALFTGIARVLRPGGLLAFSTLGPDSLRELRDAWAAVDGFRHVNDFPDMHDVGDALTRSGLHDAVLDVDALTLEYADVRSLYRDLTCAGARNCLRQRCRSLTGKGRLQEMQERLAAAGGSSLSMTLELIYGHAWGAGPSPAPGEYRIAAGEIGRLRR